MSRRVVVGALVLGLGGILLVLVVIGAVMGSFPDGSSDCSRDAGSTGLSVSGPNAGDLTPAQLANAGAIITEGRRRGLPSQALVVALATASQESHFTNYANDGRGGDLSIWQYGVEASLGHPHEAVGTDHGSLGVFQQQWPWWGTLASIHR